MPRTIACHDRAGFLAGRGRGVRPALPARRRRRGARASRRRASRTVETTETTRPSAPTPCRLKLLRTPSNDQLLAERSSTSCSASASRVRRLCRARAAPVSGLRLYDDEPPRAAGRRRARRRRIRRCSCRLRVSDRKYVDDHQTQIAAELDGRRPALSGEADELTFEHPLAAARRCVATPATAPSFTTSAPARSRRARRAEPRLRLVSEYSSDGAAAPDLPSSGHGRRETSCAVVRLPRFGDA